MKSYLLEFFLLLLSINFCLSLHSRTLLHLKSSKNQYQSPINLNHNTSTISYVKPMFFYHPVNTTLFIDNHIVKANSSSFGHLITLNNIVFNAEEITFHTLSEHFIDNKQYDMEMHIIHKGVSKGDQDKYAVISFLFEKEPGIFNDFIESLDYFNIGNSNITIDINQIMPKELSFFTYQGSLTVPPFNEKTIHYVFDKVIPISNASIEMFKKAIQDKEEFDYLKYVYVNKKYRTNNRELQRYNNRKVYYYRNNREIENKV